MISVCGLKLERMLTILYKKKKAFRIENINAVYIISIIYLKFYKNIKFHNNKLLIFFQKFNQDGTFEGSPEYIGLNTNVNKYL